MSNKCLYHNTLASDYYYDGLYFHIPPCSCGRSLTESEKFRKKIDEKYERESIILKDSGFKPFLVFWVFIYLLFIVLILFCAFSIKQ